MVDIDGLVQDCSSSIVKELDLLQYRYTKPVSFTGTGAIMWLL